MPTITLKDFTFYHIIDWEETAQRSIARKGVIGKVTPTVEAEVYVSHPKEIRIRARVNDTEKDDLWDIYNEAAWQELKQDGSLMEYVWVETPEIAWDSNLGWDDDERPYVMTLGLVCSGT